MAERTIYRYVPHRRTQARLAGEAPRPVKVVDQLPAGSKPARFNAWLAVKVTTGVGTMLAALASEATAARFWPTISAGRSISWIQLDDTQLIRTVRLCWWIAAGNDTRAIPLNAQKAHIVPTTQVSRSATLALNPLTAARSCRSRNRLRLIAAGMWWCAAAVAAGRCVISHHFFTRQTSARGFIRVLIGASSVDRDVLERLARTVPHSRVNGPYVPSEGSRGKKPVWRWSLCVRSPTVELAEQIRPLMSTRRQEQIDALLAHAATRPYGPKVRPLPPHGTRVRRQRGCTCGKCKAAENSYQRERRAARKAAGL
jgi:hypothetical protein